MNKIKRLIAFASDQTRSKAFGGGACESGGHGKLKHRKSKLSDPPKQTQAVCFVLGVFFRGEAMKRTSSVTGQLHPAATDLKDGISPLW